MPIIKERLEEVVRRLSSTPSELDPFIILAVVAEEYGRSLDKCGQQLDARDRIISEKTGHPLHISLKPSSNASAKEFASLKKEAHTLEGDIICFDRMAAFLVDWMEFLEKQHNVLNNLRLEPDADTTASDLVAHSLRRSASICHGRLLFLRILTGMIKVQLQVVRRDPSSYHATSIQESSTDDQFRSRA